MNYTPTCSQCSKPMIWQPSAVQFYCPRCHRYQSAAAVEAERKFK